MAINLTNLNNFINDKRRDIGANSIDMDTTGLRAINTTFQAWNQMHDWEWQIEETILNYNSGVTWYAVPSAHKAPIDLRYYRNPRTAEFDLVGESTFDSETLSTKRFAVSTLGQTEYLRIKASGDSLQIHTWGDKSNGSTNASAAVSNILTDSYEFYDLSSSISFDFDGTTGTLETTLSGSVDISKYVNRSSIFWNTNFSSYTNWTNMSLRVQTNPSNYWTATVTNDFLARTPTSAQWNKHKILWTDLTKVGSPSATAISSVRLQIVYSADPALDAARIENLFISENVPMIYEYYSTNMVASSTTKYQEFQDATTKTSTPLWSGKWDWVTGSFIDSTLQTVFWITGEQVDLSIANDKVEKIVENLKQRIPSRRRSPSFSMKFEI